VSGSRRRRVGARSPAELLSLEIENLSHEGRGVARHEGKTIFVDGALAGEMVTARVLRKHGRYDEAETIAVLRAAEARVAAPCPHYGICGGCSFQHAAERLQLDHKQGVLLELLRHQGELVPQRVAAPIRSPQWGYRRKARLGVKYVTKKGGVLVGFRERAKPYVAECHQCDILDVRVSAAIPDLRALIQGLSIRDRLPQIEVAVGDTEVALVMRHLAPLTAEDHAALVDYAARSGFIVLLQPGGYDTITTLQGLAPPPLTYVVENETIAFLPTDFTQVNPHINAQMVARALAHLELSTSDQVIDLFCGVGNFTLPIARRAHQVTGIEGEAGLVARARANGERNGLGNVEFAVANLEDAAAVAALSFAKADKVLLDPPRAGALTLLEGLRFEQCQRLVYVSCSPVTFARDAAVLVARHGFSLIETGILDMFPNTAHVESLSLFVRE
jgi:23S rRNA (uracil1939-C5)-methyltransferase